MLLHVNTRPPPPLFFLGGGAHMQLTSSSFVGLFVWSSWCRGFLPMLVPGCVLETCSRTRVCSKLPVPLLPEVLRLTLTQQTTNNKKINQTQDEIENISDCSLQLTYLLHSFIHPSIFSLRHHHQFRVWTTSTLSMPQFCATSWGSCWKAGCQMSSIRSSLDLKRRRGNNKFFFKKNEQQEEDKKKKKQQCMWRERERERERELCCGIQELWSQIDCLVLMMIINLQPSRPAEVFVFMVGGTTYEEALTVHQINSDSTRNARIILGGSTIHNSTTYVFCFCFCCCCCCWLIYALSLSREHPSTWWWGW